MASSRSRCSQRSAVSFEADDFLVRHGILHIHLAALLDKLMVF